MDELTKQELDEGKRILGGVVVLLWIVAIISGLGFLSANFMGWLPFNLPSIPAKLFTFRDFDYSIAIPAIYIVELVAIHTRKSWGIPLGRAALVITMVIFFPIGTIFGGILWKRINDPKAKKYLNYPVEKEKESQEK